ncbi:MAG TPA: RNA polymerase sigma-70 factor, partial [Chitinophagaceae bacterium]|nr:RNA polymerase sigma-70 factor [Chitinophagaceae bacterium]
NAFEKIYRMYSGRLYGNLLKLVKNESLAQEILQDVFVKIWENRFSIDANKSFRSYLFKIAENKVYDLFRKAARDRKLQAQITAIATEQYMHIEELLIRKEYGAIIEKAIKLLPPQRQQIFRLCKMEGRSYEEVSKLLGISVSTISDHIVKSGRTLREYLYLNLDMAILLFVLSMV